MVPCHLLLACDPGWRIALSPAHCIPPLLFVGSVSNKSLTLCPLCECSESLIKTTPEFSLFRGGSWDAEGELPAGPWVGGCVVPPHSAGRNLNILNLIHHQLVLQHTSEVHFYSIMPSVLLGILLDSCRTFQPGNYPSVF